MKKLAHKTKMESTQSGNKKSSNGKHNGKYKDSDTLTHLRDFKLDSQQPSETLSMELQHATEKNNKILTRSYKVDAEMTLEHFPSLEPPMPNRSCGLDRTLVDSSKQPAGVGTPVPEEWEHPSNRMTLGSNRKDPPLHRHSDMGLPPLRLSGAFDSPRVTTRRFAKACSLDYARENEMVVDKDATKIHSADSVAYLTSLKDNPRQRHSDTGLQPLPLAAASGSPRNTRRFAKACSLDYGQEHIPVGVASYMDPDRSNSYSVVLSTEHVRIKRELGIKDDGNGTSPEHARIKRVLGLKEAEPGVTSEQERIKQELGIKDDRAPDLGSRVAPNNEEPEMRLVRRPGPGAYAVGVDPESEAFDNLHPGDDDSRRQEDGGPVVNASLVEDEAEVPYVNVESVRTNAARPSRMELVQAEKMVPLYKNRRCQLLVCIVLLLIVACVLAGVLFATMKQQPEPLPPPPPNGGGGGNGGGNEGGNGRGGNGGGGGRGGDNNKNKRATNDGDNGGGINNIFGT